MALLKNCRCGKKISLALSRCEECQVKYDKRNKDRHKAYNRARRDKTSESFYNSKIWRLTRNDVVERDHHLCQLCLNEKRIKPMYLVHHIKELRDYPELGLDKGNLISVCNKCHGYIHSEYENGNRKQMENILKKIIKGGK